jgi:uracil-DNA glycosylase
MRSCRRCLEAGYAIEPGAVFSGGSGAQVMIVGQAPGITEMEVKRPFNGPSGRRLFAWLEEVGWSEPEFRSTHYMTAVTKCYPGRSAGGKGDRVPSRGERALCAPFLESELALVDPLVLVPVGGLAVRRFLGSVKLGEVVGTVVRDGAGRWVVPLPHPSGASLWLNRAENVARLQEALAGMRRLCLQLGIEVEGDQQS